MLLLAGGAAAGGAAAGFTTGDEPLVIPSVPFRATRGSS